MPDAPGGTGGVSVPRGSLRVGLQYSKQEAAEDQSWGGPGGD